MYARCVGRSFPLSMRVLTFALLASLLVPFSPALLNRPLPSAALSLPQPVPAGAPLLQWTAAGYALGFDPHGLYLASSRQLLRVGFIDVRPVQPALEPASGDLGAARQEQVRYPGLWPGVDLVYRRAPDGILQSTYYLQPGADPGRIRLHYNAPLALQPGGSLSIALPEEALSETAPLAWQEIAGQRRPVPAAFRLLDSNQAGFDLGPYDPAYPLVIDPTIVYLGFFGAASHDEAAVVLYGGGRIYVAGSSERSWGSPLLPHNGGKDVFVACYMIDGTLEWLTFLGSSGQDDAAGLAWTTAGEMLLYGSSSATWGAPTEPHHGQTDLFVAEVNRTTGELVWNTFIGSSGADYPQAISSDGSYLTGTSDHTWGAPRRAFQGGFDAFVVNIKSNTGEVVWNTFLGSNLFDYGQAIHATDLAVFVAGRSIETWGAPLRAHRDGYDAFVASLELDGDLSWHTFLGSSGDDEATGVIVGVDGGLYVAGMGRGAWPASAGAPLRAYSGAGSDGFLAKLTTAGALTWHTFLGGAGSDDQVHGLLYDKSDGVLHVSGMSNAAWGWGHPQTAYTAGFDCFNATFSTAGALQSHTFAGGPGDDRCYGLSLRYTAGFANSYVYLAGSSNRGWGTPATLYPLTFAGGKDAVLVELDSGRDYDWTIFSGSASDDDGRSLAVDSAGSVYLAGYSQAAWGGTPRRAYTGGYDAFAVKLNPDGTRAWHTFLGSSQDDKAFAITVDTAGNVYVAGESAAAWGSSPKRGYTAALDAFVAKLNANGTLQWHTFLGGDRDDWARGVAVDAAGNIYAAGTSKDDWGDPLVGYAGSSDGFAVKLNSTGSIAWNIFLGSYTGDEVHDLALDSPANLYLAGHSWAGWGPSVDAHSGAGIRNALAAKVDSSGDILWTAFLGSEDEAAEGIAVDSAGSVYVTGLTLDGWGAPLRSCNYNYDAFAARLNSSGTLQWITCLGAGSVKEDYGQAIAVDPTGAIYVAGGSRASWGAPLRAFASGDDAFLARLDSNGTYRWHAFLGAAGFDRAYDVLAPSGMSPLVAGSGYDRWPDAAVDSAGDDAFVVKYSPFTIYLAVLMRSP
ncbi:MAG: SBBP repeat-containing protein [Chloroflexota bacterium]